MKYIFVTGGVVSSLGKGLTAAALGALLEQRGYVVNLQKFDPYLNVDPGTMNPFQHGEVYVLDDGAETDLDLGHYERFTNVKLSRENSVSSGQVYESVIKKERRGDYLGETVQVIPHVTDEIKRRIKAGAKPGVDIVIIEIGGTTGDIEGLPFLEALRQFSLEIGRENVLFLHMTLLPYLKAAGELKSKPSQQSVAKLREIGIQPDILVCRTEVHMDIDIRKKLSLFCNVELRCVIEERDVEFSIYELPLLLSKEFLDTLVLEKLNLQIEKSKPKNLNVWTNIVKKLKFPSKRVKIAIVGKYLGLQDAYKSIYESLVHAGIENDCSVEIVKIDAEDIQKQGNELLKSVHGILIPGGFGSRGIDGKIAAARYARENDIPFFGICLGLQIAIIEFARNVGGFEFANSREFDSEANFPVIDLMKDQKNVSCKGGSMRLGSYACELVQNTHSYESYSVECNCENDNSAETFWNLTIRERHRHRFEFNNSYKELLESKGLKIAGINPELNLVEIIELKDHPWFVGVQFHPEFQSKPTKAHPLFKDFVKFSLKRLCKLVEQNLI